MISNFTIFEDKWKEYFGRNESCRYFQFNIYMAIWQYVAGHFFLDKSADSFIYEALAFSISRGERE